MAQLSKSLHIRKNGVVQDIPLYDTIADTTGVVLPLRVGGAPAYAQLVPTAGYPISDLRVRKSGTVYAVATRGMKMTQGFHGSFSWGLTLQGQASGTWLVERETVYVPYTQNVRLVLALSWSADHSGYYGSSVEYRLDGATIYNHSNPPELTGGGTTTFYNATRSLAGGAHTLDLYITIWASGGDSSTFSMSWLQNQAILSQA